MLSAIRFIYSMILSVPEVVGNAHIISYTSSASTLGVDSVGI